MGVFDDIGRIARGMKDLPPRPSLRESIKQTADAVEQIPRWQADAAAAAGAYGAASANPFLNMQMMQAGLRGTGTVTAIAPTGESFDGSGIYNVTMSIQLDGPAEADRVPYEVVHRQLIAAGALGNWQPGRVLPVRVDPEDRTQLMIG